MNILFVLGGLLGLVLGGEYLVRGAVALAWLLRHPAGIVPIVGSTQPERIRELAAATELQLSREQWYALLTSALKEDLP